MKRSLIVMLTLVVAVASAEAYLRLTVPFEIMYQTWFSRGVHTADDDFGLVYTKNFKGYMRHSDRSWNIPLDLDENGFRKSQSYSCTDDCLDVVLLGGQSQMFGYGLQDRYTIAAEIAKASRVPIKVYNTAWPSLDLSLNFQVYKKLLENKVKPKFVILGLYNTTVASIRVMSDDFDFMHERPSKKIFQYFPDLFVVPLGKIASSVGPIYYKSYVTAGIISFVDRAIYFVERIMNADTETIRSVLYNKLLYGSSKKNSDNAEYLANNNVNILKFQKFMTYLKTYFKKRDCELLVVFLPHASGVENLYSEVKAIIPPDVDVIDINEELHEETGVKGNYIAAGHYNKHMTNLIGKRIAAEIQNRVSVLNVR